MRTIQTGLLIIILAFNSLVVWLLISDDQKQLSSNNELAQVDDANSLLKTKQTNHPNLTLLESKKLQFEHKVVLEKIAEIKSQLADSRMNASNKTSPQYSDSFYNDLNEHELQTIALEREETEQRTFALLDSILNEGFLDQQALQQLRTDMNQLESAEHQEVLQQLIVAINKGELKLDEGVFL